jgi:hypothetical protein
LEQEARSKVTKKMNSTKLFLRACGTGRSEEAVVLEKGRRNYFSILYFSLRDWMKSIT